MFLAVLLVGCPLPLEFSGNGLRGITGTTVTAPVTFSYTETTGRTGVIANGAGHTAGVDTTVTLTTETPDAVIYYTSDGSGISDLQTAKRINASSGSLLVPLTTVGEQRAISAVAVGPNMRPSPITTAKVEVTSIHPTTYGVTYNANLSPISGTLIGTGTPSGASLTPGSTMPTDSSRYRSTVSVTLEAPQLNANDVQRNASGRYLSTTENAELQLLGGGTYVFDGWYTTDVSSGGTGTSYHVGDTFAMPANDVTLYAKWRQRYTITFDRNNPCTTDSPLTPISPDTITPGGHTIAGTVVAASVPGTSTSTTPPSAINSTSPTTPGNLPLVAPDPIRYLHGHTPSSFQAVDFPMTNKDYPKTNTHIAIATRDKAGKLITCGRGGTANQRSYRSFNGWYTDSGRTFNVGDSLSTIENKDEVLKVQWFSEITSFDTLSYPQ